MSQVRPCLMGVLFLLGFCELWLGLFLANCVLLSSSSRSVSLVSPSTVSSPSSSSSLWLPASQQYMPMTTVCSCWQTVVTLSKSPSLSTIIWCELWTACTSSTCCTCMITLAGCAVTHPSHTARLQLFWWWSWKTSCSGWRCVLVRMMHLFW